jgi:UDP:flavonoid glycosyltransferase YjiC (YdhE family)
MRILFASHPLTAHMRSVLPLALGAQRLGFEIAWASAPFVAPQIAAYGIPFLSAGYSDREEIERQVPGWEDRPDPAEDWRAAAVFTAREVMAGPVARASLSPLLAAAREFGPDLIVRDAMEYAAAVTAEVLDVPHASVAADALTPRGWIREAVAEPLAQLRAAAGLAPDPEMEFRHLHFEHLPQRFFGSPPDVPATTRSIRHVSMRRTEASPQAALPAGDREFVLATFGTLVNATPGLLETVLEALAELSVDVVMATGSEERAAELAPAPPNVRLQASVPQAELLGRATLFVSHGGLTSLKESLADGVPLVIVPVNSDQPYLGERCAALGAGAVVQAPERTAVRIREAVVTVLGARRYRDAAAGLADEMRALPGPGQALKMLAGLVAQRA